MRRYITIFVGALLLGPTVAGAVTRGQSLTAALEELRSRGLRLIFSSVLVRPELTVNVDVSAADAGEAQSAENLARRILAPHGLTLEPVRSGLYSVVRMTAAASQPVKAGGQATAPPRAAEPNDPLYELGVYASRYVIDEGSLSASLAQLTRDDVETLPGLNEDVLRVTRFLPGTASNALSARSHVRGGRDEELGVYFDGVPLFEPFHYKDVQSLLGLLDPGSISKIDFFSGVFPARYGNRLSGVLDIAPRTWSGRDYNELGASVLYTHGLSQGRLDDYPVDWLVSVRRGNIDVFTELLEREETRPEFLDALARFQIDTGSRSSLAGGMLLLDDQLKVNFEQGTEKGDIEYRDATGWASWRFRPDDASELSVTASRTERHTNRVGSVDRTGSAVGTVDDHRIFDTNTLRVEGSARAGERATFNAGVEWYDYVAHYNYRGSTNIDPLFATVFGSPATRVSDQLIDVDGESYAAFTSALISLTKQVAIDLALRWDAQRFGTAFSDDQVSPRVSAQYQYDADTVFRLSWGRMAQTERPDELQIQDGDARIHAAQRSTQTVLSLEHRLLPMTLLRIEAYDKHIRDPTPIYENLLDPFALFPELEADRVRVQPDSSHAHGAELSVRWQSSGDWSGWLSYSWSEATDRIGAIRAPRTWDQKHTVASGLVWQPGVWQLSGNVNWHSGWRRNVLVQTGIANGAASGVELAPRNSVAWGSYFSLDLRAGWVHALRKGALHVYGEVDNLTNHSNDCCVSYAVQSAGPLASLSPQTSTWLPRLYLLGVTWQLP
ncbi:MAG: TonB-dependent receptor [Gammaproteobacteria bacterium]